MLIFESSVFLYSWLGPWLGQQKEVMEPLTDRALRMEARPLGECSRRCWDPHSFPVFSIPSFPEARSSIVPHTIPHGTESEATGSNQRFRKAARLPAQIHLSCGSAVCLSCSDTGNTSNTWATLRIF